MAASRSCAYVLTVILFGLMPPVGCRAPDPLPSRNPEAGPDALPLAGANDNRQAGGSVRRGVVRLELEARLAAYRPDLDVDSAATVRAFAEVGRGPTVPGPLLRAPEGAEVRLSVRNALPDSSTLVVHGLRAGTVADDTLHVTAGTVREVEFRAGAPGTYLYWGSTRPAEAIGQRVDRDSQLTGAIVVDPRGVEPDPDERIFVMTVIDLVPGDTIHNRANEDIWELAVNGRSWPHSERLDYPVGDTVRWRWLNGSYLPHPMHLHGFHFRVLGKGDGVSDTVYAAGGERLVVTELMRPGSTFRMDWTPTRAGTWLMHCHMAPHITPYPERSDSVRAHDEHALTAHATQAMAGLVMGITTVEREGASAPPVEPVRLLRLLAVRGDAAADALAPSGYVLARDTDPHGDSLGVASPPLVLTRGEATGITVVNRLDEPTTVHWHGLELESVYDGVAGWSRSGGSVAPLVAPGDSFTVVLQPPRAGTFIYHTHMDELAQLATGMYGPLLVLEPGVTFDPETDHVFVLGGAVDQGQRVLAMNGRHEPPALGLRHGTTHRLRLINIHPAAPARFELVSGDSVLTWTPVAKDGADVNPARSVEGPALLAAVGAGETWDVVWTPAQGIEATLRVMAEGDTIRQVLTTRR